jgi:hypothetical protein
MGGFKEVQCYACGGAHKKSDPSCKAGPYDVHACAPAEFKSKQDEKKRKYGGKGKGKGKGGKNDDGNRRPQKKGKGNEVKHCHAFNFGKGTCRYGAKCHFAHDKKDGTEKNHGFNASQEKIVSSMVASAIKRTATHIAKKTKQQSKKQRQKKGETKSDSEGSDDESYPDYTGLMARCWMSPVINSIPRTHTATKQTYCPCGEPT